jgi:hypothetical protein
MSVRIAISLSPEQIISWDFSILSSLQIQDPQLFFSL